MSFAFTHFALTSRATLIFNSRERTLFSVKALIQAPSGFSPNNTITVYDRYGVIKSNFTITDNAEFILTNADISKITFYENTDLLYTIYVYILENTYNNAELYKFYAENSTQDVIPVIFHPYSLSNSI